jgi:hypothetical protein
LTDYFLSKEIFDKLPIGESASCKIYRKYSSTYSIESYTSEEIKKIADEKFQIGNNTYSLQHKEVTMEKVDYRTPHPVVRDNWDERVKRIKESINQQEFILEKYTNEDLNGIRTNLFVKPNYATIVEAKLNELRKNLAAMNLEADKLKDYYENVGKNSLTNFQNTQTNDKLPLPP